VTSPQNQRPRVATIGAAYCANKGAASMIQAVIDQMPDADVDVHSTYPKADTAALAPQTNVRVISAPPKRSATLDFPLAVLIALARVVHLPWRWLCRTEVLRSFRDADVVADITGISYSDARPAVFAPYHFLLNVVPWLVGAPTVKCSQAIGPFESFPVKIFAKLVLPRLDAVVSRGPKTSELLAELGIDHTEAHDLAFAMKLSDDTRAAVANLVADHEITLPFVAIAPSTLVQQKSAESGTDYVELVARVVEDILEATEHAVVLIAHSSQPSTPQDHEMVPDRLNDLVVCRELADRLASHDRVTFIDQDLSPVELRGTIEIASIVVTSRFHAMVSSLAVETPPVVIGWSHKYGEVLDEFDLSDLVIDYTAVDAAAIAQIAIDTLEQADELSAKIHTSLPAVINSAMTNFDTLNRAINK